MRAPSCGDERFGRFEMLVSNLVSTFPEKVFARLCDTLETFFRPIVDNNLDKAILAVSTMLRTCTRTITSAPLLHISFNINRRLLSVGSSDNVNAQSAIVFLEGAGSACP
jgi:hypothetical protein